MQLTNIARDVGEDARRGRVYLPTRWLEQAGIDRAQLLRTPAFSPALAAVVERLLVAADDSYARADAGVELLPADCRAAIRAARSIYADIGRVIRARGCDSIGARAHTSALRKLVLLLGARRTPSRSEQEYTCVEPVARALVEASALP
jgi:phytoene synthase